MRISPDQMGAAASYIRSEWSDYGYAIEAIESPTHAVSLFHVVASDGSRFTVAADKWGNCRYQDTHEFTAASARLEALAPLVREMHANAVTP